ncbi:MAG: hypothetical protein GC165_12825 [Armatimonadetes bacterium]|nr:hypothetical protein [Armatimonadota bacterium]MBS1726034.1 restriction endonuclease subunit S [Armatimonadota bacterium]
MKHEPQDRGNALTYVRFGDLALSYANGGTPPSSKPECWNGDIGFISTAWIAEDQIEVSSSPRTITKLGVESCSTRVVEPNALLVGTRVGVGKAAVNRIPIAISQDITAVRLKPTIDPIFAAFALKIESAQAHFRGRMRGATIQGVSRGDLQDLLIPLHSEEFQRGIVSTLEAIQIARLSRLKEIELERERKAALMAHLFTYGTQNEPRRDTSIGPLPESWEVSEIGELAPGKGGIQTGPFGSQLHTYDYVEVGIPVVNPTHMGFNTIFEDKLPKVTPEKAQELARHALQEGDILIARRGDFGKFCMATERHKDWLCGTGCFRIRVKKELVRPRFLALWISTEFCQVHLAKNAIGVTMPNLNQNVIGTTPVGLPPADEQDDICDAVYGTERKLKALEAEANLFEELFRAMLEELMSGRLSVSPLFGEVVV